MSISVIVPAYNPDPDELMRLYRTLLGQDDPDFEVLIVDDASPRADYSGIIDPRFTVLRLAENSGPARARNAGVALAKHAKLYFTDADCALAPWSLKRAKQALERETVVVGDTITLADSFFGQAVAYLGFPGGGAVGFHNIWKVDAQGHTQSLSACNLAIRRKAFLAAGGFDPSFPVPSGEDTLLAARLMALGYAINYDSKQLVYHAERSGWRAFRAWQVLRGRGLFHLVRRLGVRRLARYARPATLGNMLRRAGVRHAPLVSLLFLSSLLFQAQGYLRERHALRRQTAHATR